ncbi:hypothetical protein SEA_HYDRUS_17 [Gordonia phage Hydrus]|nr:hypothetical protein SEA_HYDRUS_17 [Gordonia phage Hydrus]
MTSSDVQDFLEHYGVKGMKWGVTRHNPQGVRPTRKMVRQVTKETRKEHREMNKAEWKSKSGGQKAKTLALDMATMGGYTASQLAKQDGYSRGKRTAITLMGGHGASYVREVRIQKDVVAKLGGQS